jgi:aspartyl protease
VLFPGGYTPPLGHPRRARKGAPRFGRIVLLFLRPWLSRARRAPALPRLRATVVFALFWTLSLPGPSLSRPAGLPFRSAASMILVQGRINGKPATFLLDTGANHTIVSEKLVDDLDVQVRRMRSIAQNDRGPGMVGEAVSFRTDVSLASYQWIAQPVWVMNLDDLKARFGKQIDGIIGQDLLREFRSVRIDYGSHTIYFER